LQVLVERGAARRREPAAAVAVGLWAARGGRRRRGRGAATAARHGRISGRRV